MATWSDIPWHPSRRTLRQFASLCAFFLVSIGTYQWLSLSRPLLGATLASGGLLIGFVGWLLPRLLRPIFVGWIVAAFPIGWAVSQIAILGIFFLVFVPVSLVLRILGRDSLQRRFDPQRASYWEPKNVPGDLARYFKQY